MFLTPKFVLDPKNFWTEKFLGSKIHLRMEFDSGVGPTCLSLLVPCLGSQNSEVLPTKSSNNHKTSMNCRLVMPYRIRNIIGERLNL